MGVFQWTAAHAASGGNRMRRASWFAAASMLVGTLAPLAGSVTPAAVASPNNLALSASVSQSSTSNGGVATRAIDDSTNGIWAEGSVTRTTTDNEAWWHADLGAIHQIDEIKLWNRTDCCEDRLADFSVFVSDVPFTSTDLATTQAQPGVSEFSFAGAVDVKEYIAVGRTGRYVRVQLHGNDILSLAEVQIGGPLEEIDHLVTRTWGFEDVVPSINTDILVEVFAIEQIGNTIYLGGRFENVIERRFSVTYDQQFIAAFDATSGDWIDWWRPELDGTVMALQASADGSRLYVGGEFTQVNGDPLTGGLVALDPATGLVDPTWRAHLSRYWAPAPAVVYSLDIDSNYLYVGGNFTHATTAPNFTRVNVYKAARFSLSDGALDTIWKPIVAGGGVFGIAVNDAENRVYLVGTFSSVNGESNSDHFFPADYTAGAKVPGLNPYPFNSTNARETFDVVAANGLVFVGGSQHLLSVLDETDLSVVNQVSTWGGGGDMQDIELVGDRVYATCHCRAQIYDNATSSGDPDGIFYGDTNGTFAVDAHTGEYIDTFPTAILDYNISAGPWAVHGAADGCLWIGGDMNKDDIGDPFINSLVKHCPEEGAGPPVGPPLTEPNWDATPPSTPGSITATLSGSDQVDLSWPAASDNDVLEYYRIYRDGQYLAASAEASLTYTEHVAGSYSYTVTAVDRTLNESPASAAAPLEVPAAAGAYDEYIVPGTFDFGTEGFNYADDIFNGTDNPGYASGHWIPDGTFDQPGVAVKVGGAVRNFTIVGISGGFSQDFTLPAPTAVTVQLVHRLEVGGGFRSAECAEVLVAVDGTQYGTFGNDYVERICDGGISSYDTFTVDVGVLSAGTHTLEFGAYVNQKGHAFGGNNAAATFDNVVAVASGPGIEILEPTDGSQLAGTQIISVGSTDFEDATGSLDVDVSTNGGASWQSASWNAAAGTYEFSWDTTAVPDGSYSIQARSQDSDNYTTTAAPINVTVGNDSPVVAITSPGDGAEVGGTTTIQVDATDTSDPAGSLDVEVSVDGGAVWETAAWNGASARYEYQWDTTSVTDGAYDIDARATDSVNNTTLATPVSVTVANAVPAYADVIAADGPTVWWRLGESTGTIANDEIGSLDGTYANGPNLGVAGLVAGSDTAVDLDGVNDVVEIPDSPLINQSLYAERTVELWFNADDVTTRQVLYEQGGSLRGLAIYIDQGQVYVAGWNENDDASADTPWAAGPVHLATGINPNQDYHVVLTLDRGSDLLSGYLNGSVFGQSSGIGYLYPHGSDIGIGAMNDSVLFFDGAATGDGFEFDGTIDEAAIYNVALAPSQVTSHFVSGSGSFDTDPTIGFVAPTAGANVSGTQLVEVSATDVEDPAFLLDVELSVDGGPFQSMTYNGGSGYFEYFWDTTTHPDGGIDLAGRVTDSSANTSSSTINVEVKNSAPGYADAVEADGPSVWYRLGETSGTVAADESGSLDATYTNGPSLGQTGLVAETDTAVGFDGADDLITVPDSNLINQTSRTQQSVELWFNATDVSDRQVLYEQGGSARGLSIYVDQGSVYVGGWNDRDDGPDTPWAAGNVYIGAPVTAGSIYHVVLVFNGAGNVFEGYLNGVSMGSVSGIGTLHYHGSDIGIGAMSDSTLFPDGPAVGDGWEFSGVIDEVAIYPYALSAAIAQNHYLLGIGSGDATPSVAFANPTEGTSVAGTVTIQVSATDVEDAAGTLDVDVAIGGGGFVGAAYNAASGFYELQWDTATSPEGPVALTARALDSSANLATSVVNVTVANAGPAYAAVVAADTPTVWWRLGDTGGTSAEDAVGSLDGTYVGSPTLGTTGLITGDANTGVGFDGIDDVVEIPDSGLINLGSRTDHSVELWFAATEVASRQVLYEQGGTARGLAMYIDQGTLYIAGWNEIDDGPDTPWTAGPVYITAGVTAGTTHHAVLVYDGASDRFEGFLDGTSVGVVTGVGRLHSHGSDIGIGARSDSLLYHDGGQGGDGHYFSGTIDEVAVYDKALNASTVSNHYSAGIS